MSAAGQIWPNTADHPPVWWLAAEILVAATDGDALNVPEDTDPRLFFVKEWPELHAYWVKRIEDYLPRLKP